MKNGDICLHIGAQRTGTTFLQRCVFSQINFYRNNIFFYSNENIWTTIWDTFDDRWDRLRLLHESMPHARIIFGRRDKESFKRSLYRKYVAQGGTQPFMYFDAVINKPKLNLRCYVNKLRDTFDDVFIYNHRDLVLNHEKVIDDMCGFIGVPVPRYSVKSYNVGYGRYMLPVGRLLNKVFKNEFNPHGLIPCHYYFLPHRVIYQDIVMPHIGRKK